MIDHHAKIRNVKLVAWTALLGVLVLAALMVKSVQIHDRLLDVQGRLLDHVERLERLHFSE